MSNQSSHHDAADRYSAVIHFPATGGDSANRDSAVQNLLANAAEHEGHHGGVVLRGGSPVAPELYVVLSFRSRADWQDWRCSGTASRGIDQLRSDTGVRADGHFADGMAGWFDLPGLSGLRTPPKWKTAIVTGLTIFPLLLLTMTVLGPLTDDLNQVVALAINMVVLLPVITWVAMPFATRVFGRWLYPPTNAELTESSPDSG